MATQLSPIRKAWYRWKSLKLPWRKRFLVGLDLQGNTYWEFKDAITANRMRRIVKYPSSTHHSDLKITPQWHQWLRHTRTDPPSLTEQSQDLVRQEHLKILAARADARWAAKESYLDVPTTAPLQSQTLPPVVDDSSAGIQEPAREEGSPATAEERKKPNASQASQASQGATTMETRERSKAKDNVDKNKDPWKLAAARGGPSEDWQPSAWGGEATSRK